MYLLALLHARVNEKDDQLVQVVLVDGHLDHLYVSQENVLGHQHVVGKGRDAVEDEVCLQVLLAYLQGVVDCYNGTLAALFQPSLDKVQQDVCYLDANDPRE